ncbi:MAG: U32 family peptidase, partial [Deltaproteobacteria bacterium]|nr:U32 family peptidase [Deltaproteobacteria bacterium]
VRLTEALGRWIKPDAIIIQDLSFIQLVRQTGFSGELHLSTLANASFPAALKSIHGKLGVDRVVVPRELSIDEIKAFAKACPDKLGLEVFIHGALCYAVSGRCYWSSYFGGKSGLRGRCVQPCRRFYAQNNQNKRFFSCQDLSTDVLAKVLLSVPQIRAWKIEGRKKGPHYVYYTVKAYKILRDLGGFPEKKRYALRLLDYALGRTGTHYNFLPQRPQNPINIKSQTGSGLLVGRVQDVNKKPYFILREKLLPGDMLRIGYEDESWHTTFRVSKYIPKKGRLYVKLSSKRKTPKGTPVFLTDRMEKELGELLWEIEKKLADFPIPKVTILTINANLSVKLRNRKAAFELNVYRRAGKGKTRGKVGYWLSTESFKSLSRAHYSNIWWWLPPAVWPEEESEIGDLLDQLLKRGSKNFVLNSPWQMGLFPNKNLRGRSATSSSYGKGLNLWAGPYCNLANALAIEVAKSLGFSGVIVSPELGAKDFFLLPKQSALPLGIVISGSWPLCISRTISEKIKKGIPFTSPKGEQAWVKKIGSNFWVYPNWKFDISKKMNELKRAGYQLVVHLNEPLPKGVKLKKRPGMWNWDVGLR